MHVSKYLAYVLRHRPDELGLVLDGAGWVDVELLLQRLKERKTIELSLGELLQMVTDDEKGRYSLRHGRIRANQGHTVAVSAVDTTAQSPPPTLYHGTTAERWELIVASGGLRPMRRHHVHLSAERSSAVKVGSRYRGTPVVLRVNAASMHGDGHVFYCSENGVWMADAVPLAYLSVDGGTAGGVPSVDVDATMG